MYEHNKNCRRTNYTSKLNINLEINRTGVEHFRIELVQNCPCETREELLKQEGFWIRELNATLNTKMAGRSKQEYYKQNKDMLDQKSKKYRERRIDKIKEYDKIYREQH